MVPKKRLQVFVSSTYQDLKEERQAAVEAILTAGHIPAGMELFAAGDQSQMAVIKRWIDESDVFMLILGGRYGSIEPETGKSYIHLEYEYAISQGKPVFAVVIEEKHLDEKVRAAGIGLIERENSPKLRDFREQVLTRLVKFWSDPRDIKLAIHETMSEFSRREDLSGWIPGGRSIDTGAVAEEIARLARENTGLRQQVRRLQLTSRTASGTYSGLGFQDLLRLLSEEMIEIEEVEAGFERENVFVENLMQYLQESARSEPRLLDALWILRDSLVPKISSVPAERNLRAVLDRLEYYGVVKTTSRNSYGDYAEHALSNDGRKFLLRLTVENNVALPETSERGVTPEE